MLLLCGITYAEKTLHRIGRVIMTIRDYVYLGLIVLAAVAFYCNGFYAGVYRCKRMYDSLLDEPDADLPPDKTQVPAVKSVVGEDKLFAAPSGRARPLSVSGQDLRGDFSNN
jgi:hypothetical protein